MHFNLFREYLQQFSTEYVSGNCTYLLFKVRFVAWFNHSFVGVTIDNSCVIIMIKYAMFKLGIFSFFVYLHGECNEKGKIKI